MPGFHVLHHLLEIARSHVHWVSDYIQPSHLLSAPSFPSEGSLPKNWFFESGDQSIRASSLAASVPPMNIQGWFPLALTCLVSFLSKGLTRVFPTIIVWKHQLFIAQPSFGPTLTFVHDYWKNHSFDYMDLCQVIFLLFNMLSGFIIDFFKEASDV